MSFWVFRAALGVFMTISQSYFWLFLFHLLFLHLNDSCITWWARIYLLKATAYLWLVHIRSAAVLCVYQIKILENCWILLDVHRSEREQKKRAENSAKSQLTFGMLVKVAVDLVNSWWIQRTVWIRVFKQGNNILTFKHIQNVSWSSIFIERLKKKAQATYKKWIYSALVFMY